MLKSSGLFLLDAYLSCTFIGHDSDYSLFKTESGKVFKLRGISQELCRKALETGQSFDGLAKEYNLTAAKANQIANTLVAMGLFSSEGKGESKWWRRWKRFELSVVPAKVTQKICISIKRFEGLLLWILLSSAAFSVYFLASNGVYIGWQTSTASKLPLLLISLISVFIHEIGHAYALHYFGQPPGAIGLKIHGPLLAAYTDVNAAWLLKPSERAISSMAGLIFQLASLAQLTVLVLFISGPTNAGLFLAGVMTMMLFMLLPFSENDGDWFMRDMFETLNVPSSTVATTRKVLSILSGLVFGFFIVKGWVFIYHAVCNWSSSSLNGILFTTPMLICLVMGTLSYVAMFTRQLKGNK